MTTQARGMKLHLQANASMSVTAGEGQADQGHLLRLHRVTKELRFHSLSEVQTWEWTGKRGIVGVVEKCSRCTRQGMLMALWWAVPSLTCR